MQKGDVYISNRTGHRFVVGKDIFTSGPFYIRVLHSGLYLTLEFLTYFKKENMKGEKHSLAVEKVKEHLLKKGWWLVETQRKEMPVNTLQGGNFTPILPSLLAYKGDKERWVWVMYKGNTSKGTHGIEEIKIEGYKLVQAVTRIPVWVYIYEADTDTVLKISLDKYEERMNRVWVPKMQRAMWFLNREEFKGA